MTGAVKIGGTSAAATDERGAVAVRRACALGNDAHGLPRNNADKRKAVGMLLDDAEWRDNSDRWIAETCKVSHTLVQNMRPQVATDATCKVMGKDGKLQSAKKATSKRTAPTPLADESGASIKVCE